MFNCMLFGNLEEVMVRWEARPFLMFCLLQAEHPADETQQSCNA